MMACAVSTSIRAPPRHSARGRSCAALLTSSPYPPSSVTARFLNHHCSHSAVLDGAGYHTTMVLHSDAEVATDGHCGCGARVQGAAGRAGQRETHLETHRKHNRRA